MPRLTYCLTHDHVRPALVERPRSSRACGGRPGTPRGRRRPAGVSLTSANSGRRRSRSRSCIIGVTSTVRNSVTCGAVNALATIAAAVAFRTPLIGIRRSRVAGSYRRPPDVGANRLPAAALSTSARLITPSARLAVHRGQVDAQVLGQLAHRRGGQRRACPAAAVGDAIRVRAARRRRRPRTRRRAAGSVRAARPCAAAVAARRRRRSRPGSRSGRPRSPRRSWRRPSAVVPTARRRPRLEPVAAARRGVAAPGGSPASGIGVDA